MHTDFSGSDSNPPNTSTLAHTSDVQESILGLQANIDGLHQCAKVSAVERAPAAEFDELQGAVLTRK